MKSLLHHALLSFSMVCAALIVIIFGFQLGLDPHGAVGWVLATLLSAAIVSFVIGVYRYHCGTIPFDKE